ncbi:MULTISPECIES: STAS-like domain-containing protein [Leptospira]|uniref:STAS-like domain-containing protein n=1 Tax=Leptospira TaxID=171 RepID=UPI000A4F6F87|nr:MULTISPECIES: DUF4325 domain-containing protein [Leptospira]
MNSSVKITFENNILSSRENGRLKRQEVEKLLNLGNSIVFDISNIRFIAGSYADELFGVLFIKLGDEFKNRISFKVRNKEESASVISTISDALDIRLNITSTNKDPVLSNFP